MDKETSRADYARRSLQSAYDLSSCGMGVQRQLVSFLMNKPDEVRNRKYLVESLVAGTGSNLIAFGSEKTFLPSGLMAVKGALHALDQNYHELNNSLWKSLAYGKAFSDSDKSPFTISELPHFFESLVQKGYISRMPSTKAAETFLAYGFQTLFGRALLKEGADYDPEKIIRDEQELMLGDARKASVGFHAQKLGTMILIAEQSLTALKHETGEGDYLPRNPTLLKNWKRLFEEDVPPVSGLISTSMKVVGEANMFCRQ